MTTSPFSIRKQKLQGVPLTSYALVRSRGLAQAQAQAQWEREQGKCGRLGRRGRRKARGLLPDFSVTDLKATPTALVSHVAGWEGWRILGKFPRSCWPESARRATSFKWIAHPTSRRDTRPSATPPLLPPSIPPRHQPPTSPSHHDHSSSWKVICTGSLRRSAKGSESVTPRPTLAPNNPSPKRQASEGEQPQITRYRPARSWRHSAGHWHPDPSPWGLREDRSVGSLGPRKGTGFGPRAGALEH